MGDDIPVMTVGEHYRQSRTRICDLVADAAEDDWHAPVPACPGWDVHDVVAHLAAVVVDANAGRLTGPPPPEVTAEQVARLRATPPAELLALWREGAPGFEQAISAFDIWPAALDVGSHEHDIRGAWSRPGARQAPLVVEGARRLVEAVDCGATCEVTLDDVGVTATSAPGDGGTFALRASAFEVFRLRLGRRSRRQASGLDWSPPPSPAVLDGLFVFGPATDPVIE